MVFICKWSIFSSSFFGTKYLDVLLSKKLMQIVFFHYYYRWRIQKAFLHSSIIGSIGTTLGDINSKHIPKLIASTVINGLELSLVNSLQLEKECSR